MDSTNHTPEPNEKSKKRKSTDPIHLSEDDSDVSFPHFLMVETTNETPIDFSIFTIQKILQCAVGNVKSAKKLRNGTVLLEVDSKQMATRALAMTNWLNIDIKVTPHRSLNSSRGVIRCRDFRECEDAEVLDALRSQGVTALKHIRLRKGDQTEPTNTFILTFATPTPPKFIKAAYLRIPVELFIPNPLSARNSAMGKMPVSAKQSVHDVVIVAIKTRTVTLLPIVLTVTALIHLFLKIARNGLNNGRFRKLSTNGMYPSARPNRLCSSSRRLVLAHRPHHRRDDLASLMLQQ